MQQNVIDYLVYLAVRLVICLIQALPLSTIERWSLRLARFFHDVLKIRRKVVEENLRHAFPDMTEAEIRDCAVESWKSLLLMVAEIAHARRKIHETNWRQHVQLVNDRQVVAAQLSDRPSICISGHYGNFEVCSYLSGLWGIPTFTVVRPLDNPYLNKFVLEFRSAKGQRVLQKLGSSGEIERLLEEGGNMVVLADQSAGPKGCWVDFFGRPASTHKAISLFSLGYDAPLFVNYFRRREKPLSFELGCEGSVDPRDDLAETSSVRSFTQWFTHRLEDAIRRDPAQYWWLHRRWKDNRKKKKKPKPVTQREAA